MSKDERGGYRKGDERGEERSERERENKQTENRKRGLLSQETFKAELSLPKQRDVTGDGMPPKGAHTSKYK